MTEASLPFDPVQAVLRHSADAALIVQPSRGVVYASTATESVMGIAPSDLIGAMAADVVHPDDVAIVLHHRDAATRRGRSGPEEIRARHGEDGFRWYSAEWWSIEDGDEAPLIVMHLRDAEGSRAARAAVARSEARLLRLQRTSVDITMIVRPDGSTPYLSPSVERILGWEPDHVVGLDPFDLVHPDDRARIDEVRSTLMDLDRSTYQGEVRVLHVDGRYRWMEINAVNLRSDPVIEGAVVHLHDVTDRRLAEENLATSVLQDSLTGLANYALLRDRLSVALTGRDINHAGDVAVVILDLDAFGSLNDALGHQHGDQVLVQAAERLDSVRQRGHTVARIASDEFALCLEHLDGPHRAIELAEEIRAALCEPYTIDGKVHRLTCSAGLAVAGADADAETTIRDAGAAVHAAKALGRNRLEVFGPEVRTAVLTQVDLQADLDRALVDEEFVLHFQPVFDVVSGRATGTEALIRWQHPTRGLVPPDQFIPAAERSHRIIPLGSWVTRSAARAALDLGFHRGEHRRTMWVNAAAAQLADPGFAEGVLATLDELGLPPGCFGIEVTESAVLETVTEADLQLRALRSGGCQLALDDFGTGYSSLTYLQQLEVDVIKIDRSFVAGLGRDAGSTSIVAAVTGLGNALDVRVVAEGVETRGQLEALEALACSDVSGFGLARPLPLDEVAEVLAETLDQRRRSLGDPLPLPS
jgi:diguanylate cyclase (GGDEF)-like protein/PAS domain S-box-containing protein